VPLFASHEQFERRNRSTFNDIEKSIIELNFFLNPCVSGFLSLAVFLILLLNLLFFQILNRNS
jgi:hypothetical protein